MFSQLHYSSLSRGFRPRRLDCWMLRGENLMRLLTVDYPGEQNRLSDHSLKLIFSLSCQALDLEIEYIRELLLPLERRS